MELKVVAIILVGLLSVVGGKPSTRIANGKPVDTLRRFPHNVNIHSEIEDGGSRSCSGSIIGEKWVITSRLCVTGGLRHTIDFHRLYKNDTSGSFSIIIENTNVHEYPTHYDDLALIELPVRLQFSDELRPISIALDSQPLENKFTVMAGFSEEQESLGYGMFRVASQQVCGQVYGSEYDQYLQLCTTPWSNNRQTPCNGNEGSALILNWPSNPTLVGIFSHTSSCDGKTPAVHVRISEYIGWILATTAGLEGMPTTDYPGGVYPY